MITKAPNGIVTDGSLVYHKGLTLLPETQWGKWFGDVVAVIPETKVEDLKLQWTGGTIPKELFREILGLFKWSYDKHGCEAQVRLYYNPATQDWKAVPMPQFIQAGLVSNENDKHPDFNKLKLDMEAKGYGHIGSAHHHCNASAFQSGTDLKDEITTEGFHYTIGNLGSDKATFQCRCVVRKINYEDKGAVDFVPYVDDALMLKDLPEPSAQWKSRMTVKVVPKPVPYKAPTWTKTKKWSWQNIARNGIFGHGKATKIPSLPYKEPLPATTAVYDIDDYEDMYAYYGLDRASDTSEVLAALTSYTDVSKETMETLKSLLECVEWSIGLEKLTPEVCEALVDISYTI